MVSGLSPICKATLTEILPKDRNAEAVGYASAVWYLGNFVGPFMGGKTLGLVDNMFILPSICAAIVVLISFFLIWFVFEETLEKHKKPPEIST
jgi:MFS family permease